jgi:lipopolysaccharide export system permease protein
MLFHSSIRKELARSFGATLVVLATVVVTMMLIRTLGLASRGSVNPADVVMVMGYTVLGHLTTILTLSLFIAIVSTLSRMYADSEMAIWFASGRGLTSFLSPLLRFAFPVLIVIALLAVFVWPWANQQIQDMRDHYETRGDLDRVVPGQFQESAGGHRVFFVDKNTGTGKAGSNIFISDTEPNKQIVTSARSARLDTINDNRFLILENGQRLGSETAKPDITLSEFKEYGIRIGGKARGVQEAAPPKTLSTATLLRNPVPDYLGELSFRFGLALASINFVLIGLAVSSVNPRMGRNGNLAFAFFAFVAYYNLLNLGQSWISDGKTSFSGMMLAAHGGTFVLAWLWLLKRHNNWTLRALLRRHGVRGTKPQGSAA